MEYKAITQVTAEKAERYFLSLAKHFARKVEVTSEDNNALIKFEMGSCHMSVSGSIIDFKCVSNTLDNLDVVKDVMGSHIIKFGEINDADVVWQQST